MNQDYSNGYAYFSSKSCLVPKFADFPQKRG